MQPRPKAELIRIVAGADGLALDETGKANGRGVYLCRDAGCIRTAAKKNSLSRSLGRPVDKDEVERVLSEAAEAVDGRKDKKEEN